MELAFCPISLTLLLRSPLASAKLVTLLARPLRDCATHIRLPHEENVMEDRFGIRVRKLEIEAPQELWHHLGDLNKRDRFACASPRSGAECQRAVFHALELLGISVQPPFR